MIEMVNGYPCANCTDVSNARRGLNPENPTSDPVKQEQLDREAGRVTEPAVTYGGSLAASTPQSQTAAVDVPLSSRNGALPAPALRLFDLSV